MGAGHRSHREKEVGAEITLPSSGPSEPERGIRTLYNKSAVFASHFIGHRGITGECLAPDYHSSSLPTREKPAGMHLHCPGKSGPLWVALCRLRTVLAAPGS